MEETTERWLAVVGYPTYEVSDRGRVRRQGRILKGASSAKGYQQVSLWANNQGRTYCVHVLVLSAFVRLPLAGEQCRHLNGDPKDNRVTNLVWGSQSENELDKVSHGTHQQARKTACINGHEFIGSNVRLYIRANGQRSRVCRICEAARKKRRLNGGKS